MTRFRWIIVALLFFITITNYIDRASISYAIDEMAKTFHFNDEQIGFILGSFGIGYLFTTFLGGIAADRYGSRITLTIAVIFWSASLFLTSLVSGFAMIFLARALLGLSEGPNFPSMTRAIGDWLPADERATALSYSLIAVPLALAIGGPIVSQLIVHLSWRGMFAILGASALTWIPLWWFLFRDFPQQSKHVGTKELALINGEQKDNTFDAAALHKKRQTIKGLWKYLFSNRTLLANYWAFFVFGYYLFFFITWLPTYLSDHYHLQLTKIGLFTVLPWALSAITISGVGYLSDFILRKTGNQRWARSYPIWISQLLAAICTLPIIFSKDINIAMLFISLAVACSMSANATFYAVNIDIAKQRAGTALGIMDAAFAIAGFTAPVITGWIVTVTGHFSAAFMLMTALSLSSVIIVFLFHHPESAEKL